MLAEALLRAGDAAAARAMAEARLRIKPESMFALRLAARATGLATRARAARRGA